MSACYQSIDSMFKSRFICASAKFEPVKEAETEIPSVELVAELVKIQLKELGFYVMVGVNYFIMPKCARALYIPFSSTSLVT